MELKRRWSVLTVALSSVAIAAGCGSGSEEQSAPRQPAGEQAGTAQEAGAAQSAPQSDKDIPKPLAENRAEANEILDEGSLDAKLADLRGHPVVVNQWGSWCPPCRDEFPYFSESAEAHADDVAFVGIDMQDERDAAEDFVAELPVPYPSIDDPDAEAIRSLGGGIVSPTTVFIDEDGEIVDTFEGAYTSREQLEADIDRYLLG